MEGYVKIISISLKNFASYESLEFNYQYQGLTLIHGATGSGKSTLCDAVPWILFGTTAKGGAVNEVLAWNADESTSGTARIELVDGDLVITRTRGADGKANDLFYYDPNSFQTEIRGKDLKDTQIRINQKLGLDADLYLAGAYFHEFSQTAHFFQTTTKNRRAICEQLVDLSLPVSLQEKSTKKRWDLKNEITKLEAELSKVSYKIEYLTLQAEKQLQNAKNWNEDHARRLADLYAKFNKFEKVLADRILVLEVEYRRELTKLRQATNCSECGSPKPANLKADSPYYQREIEQTKARENTYAEQIVDLEAQKNPYAGDVASNDTEIHLLKIFLASTDTQIKVVEQYFADLVLLSDVVDTFRAVLISNTVSNLEASTNKLLSDYFDAEIRVTFAVQDADKLGVSIFKDGNSCVYTQLSKGQRCLLKLCFGVAVMRQVANHHGVKFHQIFFDEALDGLDSDFKLKALSLLQSLELEYDSIFLVEHSFEIKAFISNSYNVQLVNGHSELIEQAS